MRYYRHLKGMTQEQLAEATGFFKTTIYRYENGQSPCGLEACECIASALGIEKSLLYDDYLLFISDGYGNKVKEIRNHMGLTQAKFATLLGVWPKTVRGWENEMSIHFRKNVEAMMALKSN